MLQDQKVQPRLLAIDRPSPKLVGFMRKHYGLASVIPQVELVIFSVKSVKDYFYPEYY